MNIPVRICTHAHAYLHARIPIGSPGALQVELCAVVASVKDARATV